MLSLGLLPDLLWGSWDEGLFKAPDIQIGGVTVKGNRTKNVRKERWGSCYVYYSSFVDIMAATSQKWLDGPEGTGGQCEEHRRAEMTVGAEGAEEKYPELKSPPPEGGRKQNKIKLAVGTPHSHLLWESEPNNSEKYH